MSPICSIMVAMAIGAITRIAVMSNLQIWKGGSPIHFALATEAKSKMAEPSGFVIPQRLKITAAT